VSARVGDLERACAHFDKALAGYEQLGDAHGIAASANNLGGLHHLAGEHEQALQLIERAVALCEANDMGARAALTAVGAALCRAALGDEDAALRMLRASRDQLRAFDDPLGLAQCLAELGALELRVGEPDASLATARMLQGVCERIDNDSLRVRALDTIAAAEEARGHLAEALAALRASNEARARVDKRRTEGRLEVLRITHDVQQRAREAESLRRRSAELERQRAAAEAIAESRRAFVAHVSHEIRTPMNGILGMAQLLLESARDPVTRDRLIAIRSSGEVLLRLVSDVLDVSRLDAGGVQLVEKRFDPRTTIERTLALLRPQAEDAGLVLALDIDPALPPRLFGDATRLSQLLFNLVGNAIKFTRQGRIDVRVRLPGAGLLRVEVQDTGVGIAQADLPRVFEPFARIGPGRDDQDTAASVEGSGLGLAIAKGIVDALGGHIDVDSAPGQGSTFAVTLPARQSHDETLGSGQFAVLPPPLPGDGEPVRVLIVDDNQLNQKLLEIALKTLGARATVVANGADAVDAVSRERFDLVLMDVRMPVMDGLEATRRIRANAELVQPPIVAITANALEEEEQRCLAAGMDAFMTKPISLPELRRVVIDRVGRVRQAAQS
jgi:signal transduction histidine kinase/ActR/RegA family two-component response regulator